MVLQVGADARHVGDDLDAVLAQQRRGPEAGKLHQLRRIERSARKDDFAGARGVLLLTLQIFDAGRALALEQHARRERV